MRPDGPWIGVGARSWHPMQRFGVMLDPDVVTAPATGIGCNRRRARARRLRGPRRNCRPGRRRRGVARWPFVPARGMTSGGARRPRAGTPWPVASPARRGWPLTAPSRTFDPIRRTRACEFRRCRLGLHAVGPPRPVDAAIPGTLVTGPREDDLGPPAQARVQDRPEPSEQPTGPHRADRLRPETRELPGPGRRQP